MAKKTKDNNIDNMFPEGQKILIQGMEDVMPTSMLPYAEHVILERALPRVEDGLKPVQRRILFAMLGLSMTPDKPHKKSARIVGECLGKYHPHGDSSVYDAMVRMAQDFNMRMTLIDGHGNFGSIDGDPAAAMRYTEARMTPLALEMLRDLDKETVKFNLNFDDTLKEPDILPGRFPNLLVNGTSGIAVGLATSIPPHNLGETIDAVTALMKKPDMSLDELMKIVPCPDFSTGAFIIDSPEIRTAYETGRGKITMRAKTQIEELKNGRKLIIATEIPYQVNKKKLQEDILEVSQKRKTLFSGISDIRDESDRTGMRVVVEVKKDADAEKILQYLFKYTDLQTTFGANMVAIANGKPQQMGIKDMLRYYIAHQEDVVTRRTKYDLAAARAREHILEGLTVAILNIDEVIALIRASKTPKTAREGLMAKFNLSEVQAQAILDLRLQRLTNLELAAIQKEYKDIKKTIKEMLEILEDENKLKGVIIKELNEIKEKFDLPRKTQLVIDEREIIVHEEDLKVVEDIVVSILPDKKLRRVPKRLYNAQLTADEKPLYVLDTQTDKKLKLFTNHGYVLTLAADDIPESKYGQKPTNLSALFEIESDEEFVSCFEEKNEGELLFYTKQGNVKRTAASDYITRSKRVQAIALKEDDVLLGVDMVKESAIILITRRGMSIRFETESVPCMGRVAGGVKCIKLDAGDSVVYFEQVNDEGEIITISDRGYAKRSFIFDYDLQGRNGKGLKTFDFKRNGSNGTAIAACLYVREPYDFIVTQFHGTETKFNTEDILIEARAGRGTLLVMALLDDIVVGAYKTI